MSYDIRGTGVSRAVFSVIVLFAMAFVSGGCADISKDPKAVLSSYLDSWLHGRYHEAYEYLSERDKKTKKLEEISPDVDMDKMSAFKKVLYRKISFEIDRMTVEGDKATAEVTITTPDFGTMFQDVFTAAFGALDQEVMQSSQIDDMLALRYSSGNVPTMTTRKDFELVNEEGKWKVYLGLEPDRWDIEKINEFFGDIKK
ncbi:MAG: hypothetical protein PHH49_03485 [Candidatus Omnitrophica bacterium]|nr:hypothetical protein [Candidatus Omnitrophota bacterium]MDD5488011.1 hypothetical protein [Candidatus Omnitrophota bacterium]